MSGTFSALTRSYWGRGNVAAGSFNTSQLIIDSWHVWNYARHLLGHDSGGTVGGGTRNSNSLWICRGSSDASAGGAVSSVGVAGTNRWNTSGAFPGAFTRGGSGTNHHWMLLENVTWGKELLLNFSQNASYLCWSLAPSGTFSGGSVSAQPTPSNTSACVQSQQTTYSAFDGGQVAQFFGDTNVTGGNNFGHFCTAPNGQHFYLTSRSGVGKFSSFVAAWDCEDQQASDPYNYFALFENGYGTSRGAPQATAADFCASRQPNGSQRSASTGGLMIPYHPPSNSQLVATKGLDALSGQYPAAQCPIIETAPQYVYRGRLIDIHVVGTAALAGSYPNAGAQERIIAGDFALPFPSVPLTI